MIGRIIGKIWKNSYLQVQLNCSSTCQSTSFSTWRSLQNLQKQCFVRKVSSKMKDSSEAKEQNDQDKRKDNKFVIEDEEDKDTTKKDNTGTKKKFSKGKQSQKDEKRVLTKKEQIEFLGSLGSDRELSREEIRTMNQLDQREREMADNIINETQYGEYDKEIDKLIEQKINEGKTSAEIIRTIIKGEEEEQTKVEVKVEGGDDADPAKMYNIFEQNPYMKKSAESFKRLQDIMDQNRDKIDKLQLSDIPLKEKVKLNRKLTLQEKFDIESRIASVSAYVQSPYADKNNIPKEISETIRVFEKGEPERLSLKQRNQLLEQVSDRTYDLIDEQKQEKIKKKTIIAQKLHASEVDQKEDQRFRDLVEVDSKNTEVQIEAPTEKEKRQLKKDFSDKRRDTFLIQQKKLEGMAKKFDIDLRNPEDVEDLAVIQEINKEELFFNKKQSEEEALFQKKLEKRKRMKEMHKFESSLQQHAFREDIDYSDPSQNFKGAKVEKSEEFPDLPDLKKLKDLQQKYDSMVVQDSSWDIHKKRSMKGVDDYIKGVLYSDKGNISSIMMNQRIQVDKVIPNEAMTVIYVFWQIEKKLNKSDWDKMSLQEQAERKFKNMMWRRSDEMDSSQKVVKEEVLNLRLNPNIYQYGPEVRFAISKQDERSIDLKREIADVVPEIIQKRMIEKYQKGELDKKVNKGKLAMEIDQAVIDLESKLEEKREEEGTLISQLKSSIRQAKLEKEGPKKKKVHIHRDSLGNKLKKKSKKKSSKKAQEFWDSLEAY